MKTLDVREGGFAQALNSLGSLVETRWVYESPVMLGRLQRPVMVEVRRGAEWFFAAIPELEIVEEGHTPDAAVKHCLETLFELLRSYARTPPQELSRKARAHWRRLQTLAQLGNDGHHRKA
ncbi:MAG: hypothetical protein NZO41_04535 [Candidatus Bipolaricaulota bacterium]|nr:hypothetical protein [Candidatus Bipolaricaulota bacterium]MDW8140945.1 hypothetical protein [Candidatus Bipolaricaulota bacterium]